MRLNPKDIQEIGKRKVADSLNMGAISDDGILGNKLSGAFKGLDGIGVPPGPSSGTVNVSTADTDEAEKTTTNKYNKNMVDTNNRVDVFYYENNLFTIFYFLFIFSFISNNNKF